MRRGLMSRVLEPLAARSLRLLTKQQVPKETRQERLRKATALQFIVELQRRRLPEPLLARFFRDLLFRKQSKRPRRKWFQYSAHQTAAHSVGAQPLTIARDEPPTGALDDGLQAGF